MVSKNFIIGLTEIIKFNVLIKIGIIGCGPWVETIIKNIEKNSKLKLEFIVCRNKTNTKKFSKLYKVFTNFEDSLKQHTADALYLAGDPNSYLEIIKKANKLKIDIIIEKPISLKLKDAIQIKNIQKLLKNKIYVNLPNLHDTKFTKTKNLIFKKKIIKVNVLEGNYGPFRKRIDPILDWGTHPLSTILYLFDMKKLKNLKCKRIINNEKLNRKVYKIYLVYKGVRIKIITGNFFRKKERKIKFFYSNSEYIMYDFDKKHIESSNYFYLDVRKLNQIQYTEPLENLLINFTKKNKLKEQSKIFDCSFNALKIIEKINQL